MSVYVCKCVCVCTRLGVCVCTLAYVHVRTHAHVYMKMSACASKHMRVYWGMHAHSNVYAQHMSLCPAHTHACVSRYTYFHVCACVCTHLCYCMCTHVCSCMHASNCTYVDIYVTHTFRCMSVCVRVSLHAHMCAQH